MAVPVGEARFVLFEDPGTTLQPGEWTGPTHVMVVEHRDDETSLDDASSSPGNARSSARHSEVRK